MLTMETTRLIERCRQGDADALGELYKAYAQRMRSVCRRYVSDRQAVDDVLHDAFVIIFTSFDRLRDARKAESWMMAITRNVASKYKDHLAALPTVPIEEAANIPMQNEETSVRGIPLDEVTRMIDRLPEGYAKVFRLSVFEGMSHKEIAQMLGIEPHSSSSQLTRAKKMLRKSLAQYWLLWLMPLLIPVALYLYKINNTGNPQMVTEAPSKEKPAKETIATTNSTATPPVHIAHATAAPAVPADTAHATRTDSTIVPQQQHEQNSPQQHVEDMTVEQPMMPWFKGDSKHWSIKLAYSGDFNRVPDTNATTSLWGQGKPDATSDDGRPAPMEMKTWSEYISYLHNADMPDDEREHLLKIAEANVERGEDDIRRSTHHDLPFTLSLSLRRQVAPQWSVETGLTYTRLASQFTTGLPQAGFVDRQKIHYVGIPLSVSYQWMGTSRWSLYSSLGTTLDIPVSVSLTTDYRLNGASLRQEHHSFQAPLQWSAGVGAGLQYNITPNVGLFAEPRLQYYIPTGADIETYRTEHPFDLSLPVGIRWTW